MLSDLAIKRAKPQDKDYKLFDSGGLYLLIRTNNSKLWRFKYRFNGKEKLLSFGSYPLLSLAEARNARDEAKKELAKGKDPALTKAERKKSHQSEQGYALEIVARQWWDLNKDRWTAHHAKDVIQSLEKRIFPFLGQQSIKTLDTPTLLGVLQKIEVAGAIETAHRIRQRVEAVFNYAISLGIIHHNPATVLKGALKPILRRRHQPAVTDIDQLRQIIRTVELEPAYPITKLALRLLALTVVRPGEVRGMAWAELDWQSKTWTIPASRMKMKRAHKVFLSTQAIEVLKVAQQFTGRGPLVFPNSRSALLPMSENAMGYLMNRAGFKDIHVPHGFRASFSSIMNEHYPKDRLVIDLMLAHIPTNAVEAAYNRAEHAERKKELYQIWGDRLFEGLLSPREIINGLRKI
ncbi:Prophage integrase IntA [Commensalibacter sp. Nvir]|uniref:tyrosine-type recombinase/integrase n=1 Tax=Commensalibacter sp. Nvir TaxID=3069817 RepID=UPI002D26F68B|nr:Prophage integrase IntA [Commensalibacter sp. Nvir]